MSYIKNKEKIGKNAFTIKSIVVNIFMSLITAWVFPFIVWWTFLFVGGFFFGLVFGEAVNTTKDLIMSLLRSTFGFYFIFILSFVSYSLDDLGKKGPRYYVKHWWKYIKQKVDW